MALSFTQEFVEEFVFPIMLYRRIENVDTWGETTESTSFEAFEINAFVKFENSTTSQVSISLQGKEIRTEGEVLILTDDPQSMIDAGLMSNERVVLINPATDYFTYKGKKYEMLDLTEVIDPEPPNQTLIKIPFYRSGKN